MEKQISSGLAQLIREEVKAQMKRYAMARTRDDFINNLVDVLGPARRHGPAPARDAARATASVMLLLSGRVGAFTHALVQRVGEVDASPDVGVVRNETTARGEVAGLRPADGITAPGPFGARDAD